MRLGTYVSLGPGNIVLDGDPAPLPKKGHNSLPILAHVPWPNGWMDPDALGTKVGLGPGHTVIWEVGNPAVPKKAKAPPPILNPCLLLWPNG